MTNTKLSDEEEKQDRFYLAIGLLLMASEIWKQLTLTFVLHGGAYQWSYIPFQLCSVPMYLCILIGLSERVKGLRAIRRTSIFFLSDYTLMSGIVTFLDTSGLHYGYAPLTIHSYIWHIVIAGVGIYSGLKLARSGKVTVRDFLPCTVLFLLLCAAAEVINLSFDRYGVVDMFYINPHYYVNQIVFNDLAHIIPNNIVIVLYILCAISAAFVVHLCWRAYSQRLRSKAERRNQRVTD